MLNLLQNHIKVKPTTLKYLYEIAAFPIDIRKQYLSKLLKRKNSEKQKNVLLLKIIYNHIEENKMIKWDEEKILLELGVTKAMLYCHKSWLLKGLRMLYFNWKEIEKKEFADKSNFEDEITFQIRKAERMLYLGMKKEARFILLRAEKCFYRKKRLDLEKKILLLRTYRHLCSMYSHVRNYNKFNYYLGKLERLRAPMVRNKLVKNDDILKSRILIERNYCLLNKDLLYNKSPETFERAFRIANELYFEIKKTNDVQSMLKMLLKLTSLAFGLKNFKDALIYSTKGHALAKKYSVKEYIISFEILLIRIKIQTKKHEIQNYLDKLRGYYEKREDLLASSVKEEILFQFANLFSVCTDENLSLGSMYKYNSWVIISKGLNTALRTLYYMKFSFYLNKTKKYYFEKDIASAKEFLSVFSDNRNFRDKIENMISELIVTLNGRTYNIYFTYEAYLFILILEIWKGDDCNFEKARYVIKRIEWLYKTRGKMLGNKFYFSISKFTFAILEESNYLSKALFLDKFQKKYEELSLQILDEQNDNNANTYYLFSFAANTIGYPELKNIVKKLYWKLEEKYPGMFEPLKKEMQERENNKAKLSAIEAA